MNIHVILLEQNKPAIMTLSSSKQWYHSFIGRKNNYHIETTEIELLIFINEIDYCNNQRVEYG